MLGIKGPKKKKKSSKYESLKETNKTLITHPRNGDLLRAGQKLRITLLKKFNELQEHTENYVKLGKQCMKNKKFNKEQKA